MKKEEFKTEVINNYGNVTHVVSGTKKEIEITENVVLNRKVQY